MRLEQRTSIALVLYLALAGLAWFAIGEGDIPFVWRTVSLRIPLRAIPVFILGMFALRTVLYRQAEKMRRGGNEPDGSL